MFANRKMAISFNTQNECLFCERLACFLLDPDSLMK